MSNAVHDPNHLLSCGQVARELNVSVAKVYLLIRKGELRSIRVGRLPKVRGADLDAFIEANASGIIHPAVEPVKRLVGRPAFDRSDKPPITDSEMKRRQKALLDAMDQAGYLLTLLTFSDWLKSRDP